MYASNLMRKLGMTPDPWQLQVLDERHPRLILNCSRQSGKSTAVAILALSEALFIPGSLILLLSAGHRQSRELLAVVADCYTRFRTPLRHRQNRYELHLKNRSRIVSLPCQPDTVRGYANVKLLVIDEAARVPDDLYRAVRPMLAVSNGRLICLSTPFGKRGFFYETWATGGAEWHKIEVPASMVSRITPKFLEDERRNLGESWVRQEYFCSFEALEGLVYPDFAKCIAPCPPFLKDHLVQAQGPRPLGSSLRLMGGLDFGFRNPFAAIWGALDRDDILWLFGEHYERAKPLSYHARHMPKNVRWYADPSGASEIAELRLADFRVWPGINSLSPGIAAVTARLQAGTLKVVEGTCTNLLAEAQLYSYKVGPKDKGSENPLDENNHALAALRYLISKLDARTLAKILKRSSSQHSSVSDNRQLRTENLPRRPWLRYDNEALWTRLW